MKIILILVGILLMACGSDLTVTPTPENIPSETLTAGPTLNPDSTSDLSTYIPVTTTVTATLQPTQMTACDPVENQEIDYEFISLECRKEECLFRSKCVRDSPVGLATIEGYYATSDHAWLDGKMYPCDSFVVVNGSQFMVSYLYNLMYQNNAFPNEQNLPLIKIDLKGLEPSDATLIKAATSDKQVSLWILLHVPLRMGDRSSCQTDIEILEVEPVKKP